VPNLHTANEQRTAFLQNYFKDFFSSESAINFPHCMIASEDSKIKEEREEEEVHTGFLEGNPTSTNLKTGCLYYFRITFKLTD
jgi:hypothetical protein